MQNEIWERWLSYFRPQNTFYYSEVNERLEVRWLNGKKILDTKDSNYSYGTLQEVLDYGLDSIPMKSVNSVLVLGMGGGCVVDSLRNKYQYKGLIWGVEVDPVVIDIAKNEFGLFEDQNVKVIQADAGEYITQSDSQFDLVIVDLFIDIHVPEQFYKVSFWENLLKRINSHGFVLFNAGIDLDEEKLDDFLFDLPDNFVYQIILNVLESNTLVIMQNVY